LQGYTYSVFNLVYETNVASCRIWDALGFKRIGRVKGCGNLKSYPDTLIDAIIYGRDLAQDDDYVSEERFDKIRFYLKNGKYPNGADRAEKSRLRSAATHYKLEPAQGNVAEKLMLKGKEVISDPQTQYEIARVIHHKNHGGINKTTATIAEQFHWVRIKETVSQVIRNCPECSEMNKGLANSRVARNFGATPPGGPPPITPTAATVQYQPQPHTGHPDRPDSPSAQLELEAAQAHNVPRFPQHGGWEMPVDPALMDGMGQPMSLEDLPPSPFLAAGRGLNVPDVSHLDLPIPDLPPPLARIPSDLATDDTNMTGIDDDGTPRTRNAAAELRRRMVRAGYPAASTQM
jgi:hypothetical protein